MQWGRSGTSGGSIESSRSGSSVSGGFPPGGGPGGGAETVPPWVKARRAVGWVLWRCGIVLIGVLVSVVVPGDAGEFRGDRAADAGGLVLWLIVIWELWFLFGKNLLRRRWNRVMLALGLLTGWWSHAILSQIASYNGDLALGSAMIPLGPGLEKFFLDVLQLDPEEFLFPMVLALGALFLGAMMLLMVPLGWLAVGGVWARDRYWEDLCERLNGIKRRVP